LGGYYQKKIRGIEFTKKNQNNLLLFILYIVSGRIDFLQRRYWLTSIMSTYILG